MNRNKRNNQSGRIIIIFVSALLLLNGCSGEDQSRQRCLKDYLLSGMVIDSSGNPLSDVSVLRGSDDQISGILIATTDIEGRYTFTEQTKYWYSESRIKFYSEGYQLFLAEPFSREEAGPDVCGSISLERDGILQPR